MNKNAQLFLASVAVLLPLSANAALINSGFESPSFGPSDGNFVGEGSMPGWHTTAAEQVMEVWYDNTRGVPAYEGLQFLEMDAASYATIFQDASGIAAGSVVGFQFAHRGRSGFDTMRLDITDLGVNNLLGGGDDTLLFSKQYSDDNVDWGFYTGAGERRIVALGNSIRVSFVAISSAGGPTNGNFLDAANFGAGIGVSQIPEPMTFSMVLAGLVPLFRMSKKS